jgi:hypothetical protein
VGLASLRDVAGRDACDPVSLSPVEYQTSADERQLHITSIIQRDNIRSLTDEK